MLIFSSSFEFYFQNSVVLDTNASFYKKKEIYDNPVIFNEIY